MVLYTSSTHIALQNLLMLGARGLAPCRSAKRLAIINRKKFEQDSLAFHRCVTTCFVNCFHCFPLGFPTLLVNTNCGQQLMDTQPFPVASEETPLIDSNHQESGARCSYLRSRFSPVILIVPIAIICRFTMMLPSTTNFRIVQVAACRFWYYLNDPEAIPSSGRIPDELCSMGGVNQYYAAMASILAVGDGVGSLFCLS